MMLLTILIPTYNRAIDLDKNLSCLVDIITKGELETDVDILIANNSSSDNTDEIVKKHINKRIINITYYSHSSNIGLEANALFVLDKALSEYVMYLGDDDYISFEYLFHVVKAIKEHKNLSCITPDFYGATPDGVYIFQRDKGAHKQYYKAGFDACLANSWKAHQLSGLVLKREGLHEIYLNHNVNNIYPFIFFVAYSCLVGDAMYIPEYPVRVTQVPQTKKDWNYGDDGLIGEVFDNYARLKISNYKISKLEIAFIRSDPWRFLKYKGLLNKLRVIFKVVKNNDTKLFAKLFCLTYVPYFIVRQMLKNYR